MREDWIETLKFLVYVVLFIPMIAIGLLYKSFKYLYGICTSVYDWCGDFDKRAV